MTESSDPFRAMLACDVFVDAIDNAAPEELAVALSDAREWSSNPAVKASRRHIWGQLAILLNHVQN